MGSKVFSFIPVTPVPVRRLVDTTTQQVTDLLTQFELADQERQRLREENPLLFQMLDGLEERQKEIKDSLKRLLHTKGGPPPQVRKGAASHIWAKGETYFVEVTYKKHADYYDPAKLPSAIFFDEGVVRQVDTAVIDEIVNELEKDPEAPDILAKIKAAKVRGEYMTPAVSVARATRDSQVIQEE